MSVGIFGRIREFWHWLTANKYVQMLEAEIERLRAENRALMNSILGIAGVPPVITTSGATTTPAAPVAQGTASATSKPSGNGSSVAPLRRRSWQQVNRTLEIEAARKKDSDGKTSG